MHQRGEAKIILTCRGYCQTLPVLSNWIEENNGLISVRCFCGWSRGFICNTSILVHRGDNFWQKTLFLCEKILLFFLVISPFYWCWYFRLAYFLRKIVIIVYAGWRLQRIHDTNTLYLCLCLKISIIWSLKNYFFVFKKWNPLLKIPMNFYREIILSIMVHSIAFWA